MLANSWLLIPLGWVALVVYKQRTGRWAGAPHRTFIALTALMVAGTGFFMAFMENLFAESHLASYDCCVMDGDLPPIGTFERTMSDFFRTPLGEALPMLLFVALSVALVARALRRHPNAGAVLSVVLLGNILYIVADIVLVMVGWAIVAQIWGPAAANGPYDPLAMRLPAIGLHLALWIAYFAYLWHSPTVADKPTFLLKEFAV